MTISLTLPPSKTCEERILLWTAVPGQLQTTGVLELREAKKTGNKPKVRRYLVKLVTQNDNERIFTVTKPGGAEFYHCCLRVVGHDECVCVAYLKDGKCSHLQALRALVPLGHLNPPGAAPV